MKTLPAILFLIMLCVFISGCGAPIPGVDIPVDPEAFWDPDIPDYADDGNIYSISQLTGGGGLVYDHKRHLEQITITLKKAEKVANLFTQIQNQLLNLKPFSLPFGSFENIWGNMDKGQNNAKGLLKKDESALDSFYRGFSNLAKWGWDEETIKFRTDRKINIADLLDKTYKDSAALAKQIKKESEEKRKLVEDALTKNTEVEGNLEVDQVDVQLGGITANEKMRAVELKANTISVFIAGENTKLQYDQESKIHNKGISVGAADPYHPTENDLKVYERKPGQGFLKF